MLGFTVTWHPDRPLTEDERAQIQSWTGVHTEVDPRTFQPLRNKSNDYLVDRALPAQRPVVYRYSRHPRGRPGGPGGHGRRSTTAPASIWAARTWRSSPCAGACWKQSSALAERGETPYEARNVDSYRVRSAALVLPRAVTWNEGAADALTAQSNRLAG